MRILYRSGRLRDIHILRGENELAEHIVSVAFKYPVDVLLHVCRGFFTHVRRFSVRFGQLRVLRIFGLRGAVEFANRLKLFLQLHELVLIE